MTTKLTIDLDQNLLQSLQKYAQEHQLHLSELIEKQLRSLVKKEAAEVQITPLVQSLTGVLPEEDNQTIQKDFSDYLNKKYT